MTDERIQQLITKIEQNMISIHNADRRTQNRLHAEIRAIQQTLAIEWGARHGLRYVDGDPDAAAGIITFEDLHRPEAIRHGSHFNMKALREGKVWAYSRHEGYGFDSQYMDHPYFYRDHRNRAAAIVAHLYGVPDDLHAWATSQGLQAHVLTFPSWWNPGGTTAVMYHTSGSRGSRKKFFVGPSSFQKFLRVTAIAEFF